MKQVYKIIFALILNLTLSAPTYAEIVKEKRLNYKFDSELLMKGKIHYSFRVMDAQKLKNKFSTISQIDTLNMTKRQNVKFMLSKIVYVVNKPIGFFDHKQMIDPKFLSHLSGRSKLKSITEESFRVSNSDYNYLMKVYFDSDDVSTLPNARAINAVSAARRLDIISQSSPAILVREYNEFSKFQDGAVTITAFVPLKENKTLAITYHLAAVKEASVTQGLEDLFKEEIQAQRDLLNNYLVK